MLSLYKYINNAHRTVELGLIIDILISRKKKESIFDEEEFKSKTMRFGYLNLKTATIIIFGREIFITKKSFQAFFPLNVLIKKYFDLKI